MKENNLNKRSTFLKNPLLGSISMATILILTFFIFAKGLNHSYVYWDDDRNFLENPLVNSKSNFTLSADLVNIFKLENHVIGNYNPLTIAVFRIENALWGMNDDSWFWWHLTNILLHLCCTFLVYKIGRALSLSIISASCLALLFGIHPMRVESVIWLTELKDVLFSLFYLLAIHIYIYSKKQKKPHTYIYIIIPLFILSGLSKIQAVSLPLSMLAIDYYRSHSFSWKMILSKWHYFIISLGIGLIGIYTLGLEGSLGSSNVQLNGYERLFIGSYSFCIYIMKAIFPYEMSPMYPYPPELDFMHYISMLGFLVFVGLGIWAYLKKHHVIVFGLSFFFVNIVFLLQIVGAGQGFKADRFTYIPYLGLFFIIAYYIQKIPGNSLLSKIMLAIGIIYISLLGYKSVQQTEIWKNSYTLWSHVLKYYPNTKLPWGNRANYLRDQGRNKEALADYNMRLSLGSNDPEPFNSRGKLYFNSNNRDTLKLAFQDYSKAIELNPKNSEYYVNRGSTNARLGNLEASISDYNKALALNPNNSNGYFNRSIINHRLGRYSEEEKDLEKYLQFYPNNVNMLTNMAAVKRLLKKPEEGMAYIEKAIQIKPISATLLEKLRIELVLQRISQAKQTLQILQQNKIPIPEDIKRFLKK